MLLIDKVKFDISPDLTVFGIHTNLTLTIPAPGPAAFKLSRDNMLNGRIWDHALQWSVFKDFLD